VNVRAKKELGQHFLVDENLLGVIGRMADLDERDIVLEVGPGLGVLTRFLANRVAFVQAIEVDRSLEPHLQFDSGVRVTYADALGFDLGSLDPAPNKLVANLPYSIATPLVAESFGRLPTVERWCVMVQREVADRFFAEPGSKAYGAVSVLIQLQAERTGFHPVSRTVFRPRPNVDSALVAFRRIAAPAELPRIRRVVEGAFAHRRKTIPNSLSLAGVAVRAAADEALAAIGRPPTVRAEALAPPEFVALAAELG
jgi:16S rRNA (adenine1518-N6/adenine1519-N6)-dimethyltransferase